MGLLGEMTVRFGGNSSGLQSAVGGAKNAIASLASNPLQAVGTGLLVVASAAVGFGAVSLKAAADFQSSMSKVQAYAGLTKSQTDSLGNSILSLATSMGQSPKAMADALYPIISSGYSASQSLMILKLAAETSAASGANMAVVADALTTSLKAMHAPASDATNYMDMINKMVSLGKGQVSDYAAVIGKLALSAGSAGVPFNDMAGSLATLTTHGFPSVAQASTSLGNLFTQIGPKVDSLTTHAQKLGLSFDENTFKTDSLSQKLAYLQQVTGGNQGELLKLVGGSTVALKAFNALEGSGTDWTNNLKAMKDATGTTASVFATTYNDWNNSTARLSATFQVLEIKVGQALLPVLTKLLNQVTPIIAKFTNWISTSGVLPQAMSVVTTAVSSLITGIQIAINIIQTVIGVIQAVIGWFDKWHMPIMVIAGIILAFFLPAIISSGVQATIAGAKIAADFVTGMAKAGAEAVINGAKVTVNFVRSMIQAGIEGWQSVGKIGAFIGSMVATGAQAVASAAKVTINFIGSMIASGAQAVASAAKVTASFIGSMIQTGVQAAISAAKVVGTFVVSMITTGAQAVATAATFMASLIPAIISFAAEALIAAATAIPAILAGFIAWIAGALAVAAANIAAFWPVYLIIAVIIAIIVLVIVAVKNWGAIAHWLQGVWSVIKSFFSNLWNGIKADFEAVVSFFQSAVARVGGVFTGLGSMMHTIWSGIVGVVKGAVNIIINAIDQFIGFIDSIQIHIPSIGIGPVHTPAFDWNGLGIPKIPMLAMGGMIAGQGWAIVGEKGPELVKLPQGANVFPNSVSSGMSSGQGNGSQGQQDIYIQLDSTTLTHVVSNKQMRMVRLKQGRRAA